MNVTPELADLMRRAVAKLKANPRLWEPQHWVGPDGKSGCFALFMCKAASRDEWILSVKGIAQHSRLMNRIERGCVPGVVVNVPDACRNMIHKIGGYSKADAWRLMFDVCQPSNWPRPLQILHQAAKTPERKVAVLEQRVEWLIKKGE